MVAREILTLDTSIAPRLLRILYPLTLLMIALMLLLGVAQGMRTIASPPRNARPPMMAGTLPATPQTGVMQPPAPVPGMMGRGMMGRRDAYGRPYRRGPGFRAVNPVLAGTFIIVRTMVIAAILTMVVRILAEMALTMLALPKRSENS
jgi:hypothetical protein